MPVELVDVAEVQGAQPTRWVVGLEPGQPVYRLLVVENVETNLANALAELAYNFDHDTILIWLSQNLPSSP